MSSTWESLSPMNKPGPDRLVVVVINNKEYLGATYLSSDPGDEGLCIHVEEIQSTWNIDLDEVIPDQFYLIPERSQE